QRGPAGAPGARARAGGRAPQGEEPAAGPAGAELEDRQREGQPARLLRHRARRLPRHVRARGGVGESRRRGREARGRRLPPAGEADGGRARADSVRAARESGAAAVGRGLVKSLALLIMLAAPALAADDLRLPPITRATFDNGLRVLIAEYHELPLVEFHLIVGAGAAEDSPGKGGLAALTAGTLTRGTGKLSADELARTIESLGGRITATPGTDGTIVTAEFLSQDFAAGLDLLRQVLLDPAFARDEVRRRRDEQAAGIVAALEDASAIADECFAGFLYGSHPYGRPIEGLSTTVPKLGRGDVADFYERWYRPNDTILVLVGDVAAASARSPRRRPRPRRSRSRSRSRASSGAMPRRASASPRRRHISAGSSRSASRAPTRSRRAWERPSSTRSVQRSWPPTARGWRR